MLSKMRSRKSQRGAAALEFAVVAPVLIMLICGMVDFAMLFNGQAVVTNGARDTVRAASLGQKYAGTITVLKRETGALPNSAVVSWSVCTAATVEASAWDCTSGSVAAPNSTDTVYDNARVIGNIVRVTVTYPYTWVTPLPTWIGQGTTANIRQVSYMRIETT